MNKTSRKIKTIFKSRPINEGAGVYLKRAFGFNELPLFDPFLLLDDFRSQNPKHYLKGFPWHPHRGIETVTYILQGDVEHQDSLGNKGIISSGDIQWMTAGSGIIHQEMPLGDHEGYMLGFQLWANLPASSKMTSPTYRDVKNERIPVLQLDNGTKIKIICGHIGNIQGPVHNIKIDPEYLDISIPPKSSYEHPTKKGHTVFAYIIDGNGYFNEEQKETSGNESVVLFEDGKSIFAYTEDKSVRFLLVSGKPIGEPIAWLPDPTNLDR